MADLDGACLGADDSRQPQGRCAGNRGASLQHTSSVVAGHSRCPPGLTRFIPVGLTCCVCDNVRYVFLLLDDIYGEVGRCQRLSGPTVVVRTALPQTLRTNGRRTTARFSCGPSALSLIHISEPTRRTPISDAVFC